MDKRLPVTLQTHKLTHTSVHGDWSVPGFEEWTSFLSCPDTRTLRPLLLLSGSLLLKTKFEELQLLHGSLWPETFPN